MRLLASPALAARVAPGIQREPPELLCPCGALILLGELLHVLAQELVEAPTQGCGSLSRAGSGLVVDGQGQGQGGHLGSIISRGAVELG
jgi:hypothetical protein